MFKAENTGVSAWKKIFDSSGVHIADLTELYDGDWAITKLTSLDWVVDMRFSNAAKAANWLWKNRQEVGEPFSLYEDVKKVSAKKAETVIEEIIEEVSNDLFAGFTGVKKK